jgi:cysteine dioxygenase
MNRTLEQLFAYLNDLPGRASVEELTGQLSRLDVTCDDLAEFIKFSDRHYTRNLVRGGLYYHALVLCWKNGQRSPIHDHKGSSCGVRVLRGTLTETFFEVAANGLIKATRSRELSAGAVCASQDTDIHQISNLQAGSDDVVTLHVYSPPLLWMGTYSLIDRTRGQEPMFVEFSDAAGI